VSDIIYLRDREYRTALVRDLASARIAHLSTVRLTRSVEFFFSSWLRNGGQLWVVTNALRRWPADLVEVIAAAAELRALGAQLTHYNAPYLLHSKLLTFAPDIVYLGSHNFTGQSLGKNIERSIRVQNQQLYDTVVADIRSQGGWF